MIGATRMAALSNIPPPQDGFLGELGQPGLST